ADGCPPGSLLTPHPGELARLLSVPREKVEANPVDYILVAAREFRTTVLLKGYNQYVATESGKVTRVDRGVGWTAQAGSGDVLAGMAGTLLAQLRDPVLAGLAAAMMQVHVTTEHKGPYPPDRMVEFLPTCIGNLVAH
ncbi:MAG: NAD(P)H-hydrate epimerase, partial [Propionibacteriaceae bacterium]|nr:NAD(P)H-hydrate epimerase [Propionibacteriaceae bacterium]